MSSTVVCGNADENAAAAAAARRGRRARQQARTGDRSTFPAPIPMNKIDILIEGYARENNDGTISASPTTVLLESNGLKVLVDPGANSNLLTEKLNERGITTNDIDIIFLSHYHLDHILNIRMFPKHAIYDAETIYENDLETFYEDKIPGTEISVLLTPGHAAEHASLLLEVEREKYVIAQDVFWWMDGKQDSDTEQALLNLEDEYAKDMKLLIKSREKVLKVADWIIPGHGKMFKNPRKK